MKQKHKKLLLIVLTPDDTQILENALVSELMHEQGYTVVLAYSEEESMTIIREHYPSVVLLDDAVLESGKERILSEILSIVSCPVILMTAYICSTLAPKFIEMGVYGCVRKSFEPG